MRKAKPKKRQILPDPVFGDVKVTRFVNHLMYDGKKNTAFEIFYSALETVKGKLPNEEKSALEIWKAALDNITPQVEVKSRRVGGATFQVPTEIRPDRKDVHISLFQQYAPESYCALQDTRQMYCEAEPCGMQPVYSEWYHRNL